MTGIAKTTFYFQMHFLKCICPVGPINNDPTLVQIMAWRRTGDKPLSAPIMARPLTHVCVTRSGVTLDLRIRPSGSHLPFYVPRTLIGYTEKIQTWVFPVLIWCFMYYVKLMLVIIYRYLMIYYILHRYYENSFNAWIFLRFNVSDENLCIVCFHSHQYLYFIHHLIFVPCRLIAHAVNVYCL